MVVAGGYFWAADIEGRESFETWAGWVSPSRSAAKETYTPA